MLPLVTYEMVHQRNQERIAKSIRNYWLRHADANTTAAIPPVREADVIELVFGAACEVEDAIA